MSLRTSATRYAKALLDVAIQESDPATIERDLASVANAVTEHAELRRILTSPGTPASARVGVVAALAARAAVQPPVAKRLAMLAERGRRELLPVLLDVYRERLMEHRNVLRAEVTTAVPLSPERTSQLQQRLAAVTGRVVTMTTKVDSSLIGGVVTRIGSTVYDGSVATQLAKFRDRLEQR